jgi:hypothetical protein
MVVIHPFILIAESRGYARRSTVCLAMLLFLSFENVHNIHGHYAQPYPNRIRPSCLN